MNLFDGCEGQALGHGLAWLNEPSTWQFDRDGLTVVPEGNTDFFRPYGREAKDTACLLYKEVTGDFTVVTKTKACLVGFGDAAAVTVRVGETLWAKLCLELSPIGDVSVVSVVTDPWSDDANGELLDRPECYLRVTRKGDVIGMHHSLDGITWRFARTFGIALPDTVMVGVHAQAPFGDGCRATFDFLELTPEAVRDFRSGE